jgi:membrane protein DedA with SNARE-associated domain
MTQVLFLLIKYKYLILLPIAILEGPFAAIIVGFLASSGVFNFFSAYGILVVGDMIGDSFYYFLGRLSGASVAKHGYHLGITQEKLENAKKYFADYHHQTLIISKLAYGIGLSGLVAAGILKVSYKKFIKTCMFIALIQSAFLLSMGFVFGHAYLQIGKYLNVYARVISIVVLILVVYFIFIKIRNSLKINKK